MNKTGLVLSGGGAKGAYEVGVVRYLVEQGIKIDALSGASIGALNGAIIAGSSNLKDGYQNLAAAWHSLGEQSPIGFNTLKMSDINLSHLTLLLVKFFGSSLLANNLVFLKTLFDVNDTNGLFDTRVGIQHIKNHIDIARIKTGTPLYVSVYKCEGKLLNTLKYLTGTSSSSQYLKLQNFNSQEIINILLATSSLPFIFNSVKIGKQLYQDGCLGDSFKTLGNTPIIPLITEEKCTTIIVVHLSNGSIWNRHQFKNINIIEIRPQSSLTRQGLLDTLSFNQSSIQSWIEQGYNDAKMIIGKTIEHIVSINTIFDEFMQLRSNFDKLENSTFKTKFTL